MRRILRLYPRAWRERYGDEMEAILGERPMGPFDLVDLALGALDAHLHLRGLGNRSEHRKGITMSLRTAGIAAIIGGAFWALTWLLVLLDQFIGAGEGNVPIAFLAIFISAAALLVALAGLSAFQARQHPRAIWLSFLIPAAGIALVAVGFLGMGLVEGFYWVGLAGLFTFTIGSVIFGAVTYRAAALTRQGSALLGIGGTIQALGLLVMLNWDWDSPGQAVLFIGMAVFALGWITVGTDAIRRDRTPLTAGPAPA